MNILKWAQLKKKFPPRPITAHKGDFGHVLVIGGAPGFSGAVRLAGESALRVGAGVVSIATHPKHAAYLTIARPELMCHAIAQAEDLIPLLARATVILIGPGLGTESWSKMLWDTALAAQKPMLIDADGLHLLAEQPVRRNNWILTPHPGEAARLLSYESPISIQADRQQSVRAIQLQYGGVAVLKGAGTLIATQQNIFLNDVANPAMATAGMGDVLSGLIAGLYAQGLSQEDAAQLGIVVHSKAAVKVSKMQGQRGMLASDIWKVLARYINP